MICVTLLLEKYVIFHRFILRFDKDDFSLHTDDCSLSFLPSFKTGTGLTPVPPLSPPFYFLNFCNHATIQSNAKLTAREVDDG